MPRIKINDLKAEKVLKTEEMFGVRGGGARFRGRGTSLTAFEATMSSINYRGSGTDAAGEVWGISAPAYSYSNWFRRSYGNYAVYG